MEYRFLGFCLDTDRYALRSAAGDIPARPKVFEVLSLLVANRHRVVTKSELLEQVWAGRAVSTRTLASTVKEARQVLGDSGTDPRFIETIHGVGYRFVAPVDTGPEGPPPPPPTPSPSIDVVRPREVASPVVPGPLPTAERRAVTVLAAQLVMPERDLHLIDSQDVHALRTHCFEMFWKVLDDYAGTPLRRLDDGVVALFGAPVAQEDHARRAAFAALALRHRLRGQLLDLAGGSPPLAIDLQVGLHAGRVLSSVDHHGRLVATPEGDTLDRAERLMREAGPGVILLSPAVHQRLLGEVVGRPLQARGDRDLSAFELLATEHPDLGSAIYALRAGRRLSDFVGREPELAMLESLWRRVEQGRGQVVIVVSPPGLGKSRLVYELGRRLEAEGARVVGGFARSFGESTPYLPLAAIVGSLCGLSPGEPFNAALRKLVRLFPSENELEKALPYLLAFLEVEESLRTAELRDQLADLAPTLVKERTFALLTRMLADLAERRPLLMVVEDLQWIDSSSEAYLSFLADRIAPLRIMLVLTRRPGGRPIGLDRSYLTQVALPPLSAEASRTLLVEAAAETPPEAVIRGYLERAGGNPLFLEELGRSYATDAMGDVDRAVPEAVGSVILARVDQLPPDSKRVLQVSAVLGREVPLAWLSAVTKRSQAALQLHLDRFREAELLHESLGAPEGRLVVFSHALTQDAVYQSMPAPDRRHLHRQVAEALLARFPGVAATRPEVVARHLVEGGLSARAVPHWTRAGWRANERSAVHEALGHFNRASAILEVTPLGPARDHCELELQLGLAAVYIQTEGYMSDEVRACCLRAQELCHRLGDDPRLLPALGGLARHAFVQADLTAMQTVSERMLALARDLGDPRALIDAHFSMGLVLNHLGELEASLRHFEAELEAARSVSDHNLPIQVGLDPEAVANSYLALTYHALGDIEQSHRLSELALDRAHYVSHPRSLACTYWLDGCRLAGLRLYHEAEHRLEQARLTSSLHYPVWVSGSSVLLASVRLLRDGDVSQLGPMREQLEAYRATGHTVLLPFLLGMMAEAYLAVGRVDAALDAVREAFSLVERTGERFFRAELYRLRAEGRAKRAPADRPRSQADYERARETARDQRARLWELRAAMGLARLWMGSDRAGDAKPLLSQACGYFTEGLDLPDLEAAWAVLEAL